ncbi:hypothetical protein F4813DRAFT_374724 [Daldinia decipiens]|uniref:uncharacterized protein n=1 Tax=Daldinia decipiens TaxID=326647 RepID=UPI0020C2841C|nr:uncharacterized protein F4813DRAFT_374724 [Daldinia decipiens]KAI1653419.1 hypothetical protein F4813DRAFT_374724 [Daldinia decipiens]
MYLMALIATAMLLFTGITNGHFTVEHPPTIGQFDDEAEGDHPCGGYSPDITKVSTTDFHVDGDVIATTLTHPESTWLYRINIDPTAQGNWTEVWPIFQQSGQGKFCNPRVTIPHEFVGKKGFIGIVSHAVDGFLYQCSAVHFIEGTATTPSDCTNGSSVTTSWISDDQLTAKLNESTPSSSEQHTPNFAVSSKGGAFQGFCGMLTIGLMVVLGVMLTV